MMSYYAYFIFIVILGLSAGYGVTMKEILERIRGIKLNKINQTVLIVIGVLSGVIGFIYSSGNIMSQLRLSLAISFSFTTLTAALELYIENFNFKFKKGV